MNSEEIIEMAKQAGLLQSVNGMVHTHTSKELIAFVKLVAAKYEQKIQDLEDMITELQERQE